MYQTTQYNIKMKDLQIIASNYPVWYKAYNKLYQRLETDYTKNLQLTILKTCNQLYQKLTINCIESL